MNGTIEEFEGEVWPDPGPTATHLVRKVHALRRSVVRDLTNGDLRILLGQNVGTATLLPLALSVLERDPAASGDLYPGDLLTAVLRLPERVWTSDPQAADRVRIVLQRAIETVELRNLPAFRRPAGLLRRWRLVVENDRRSPSDRG